MPKQQSKQNYLHGAAILTVGVIITKILGAFYKIPLGNILGDEGYAHFMVAYSIFNVFLTLTTAGLDMRQIDAMHGMTTACFRILDEAEKALNAQRGKANPGSEGGFQ